MTDTKPSTSLGGLKILDFSRVLAGPLVTMVMADLGASVVKVERPGKGDDTRSWGPPYDQRNVATYFDSVNRNKSSLVLDLRTDADLALARDLAAQADVIVENFRPGVMDGYGLGYEQLRAANPGLVYCSITGFGVGKGAELPGYDLLVQALGGLMSVTGERDGQPQKVGVALVDVVSGLFATVGILAALRHRDASGQGQLVNISLLESLLAALVNQASSYTAGGRVPGRLGNAHPSISPYELYPCADGELVLAVGNDRQFADLAAVLGAPALSTDERFATNEQRVANRDALRRELIALLSTRGAQDWADALTEVRVPAGVVNDIAGAFALAERLGLEPFVTFPAVGGAGDTRDAFSARGEIKLPRNPINLSATPAVYRSAPPMLGERTPDDWAADLG